MHAGSAHEVQGTSCVIRPNRSLPVVGIVLLFAGTSAWALAIGVGFALFGVSLILPFSLLQVLLVGLLCRWIYRHLDDCELITLEADRVRVMQRRGAVVTHHEFPRHWVRVRLEPGRGTHAAGRLRLGAHGSFVTLAVDVAEDERAALARELQRLLRLTTPEGEAARAPG